MNKSEHELELEAELKGLLSGAVSAGELSKRETRAAPELAAPYDPAKVVAPQYGRLAQRLAGDTNHDCRDPATDIYVELAGAILQQLAPILERLENRTVRMETRITNTMRYLGFPPRAPYTGTPMGRAVWQGDDLVLTGPNVPVRDLSWAVARRAPQNDVRIILNNMHWATLHVNPRASEGYEERIGE